MNELDIIKLPVGPLQANAYLVHLRGKPESILIDPGDDHAQLRRAIDGRALRVTDILLTHGHFDHILSAARIQREEGARVWIRADDAPPYFTILIVGHLMAPALLIAFVEFRPDPLLLGTIFSVGTVALSLYLLPRLKGALIGLQWAKRMHGFGASG